MGFKIAIISNEIEDLPFMSLGDISIAGTEATPLQ